MGLKRPDVYHNLATLLEAGISVAQGLRSAVSGESGRLPDAMRRIADGVDQGEGLASQMAQHRRAFPEFDILIAGVGEQSGRLPQCFEMLSEWHGFRARLRNIVFSGLAYPMLIVFVAAFIIPLPPFVLGQITDAEYLWRAAWYLAIFFVPVGLIVFVVFFLRPEHPIRRVVDHVAIRLPLMGSALKDLALSRYASTVRGMYEAGLGLADATELGGRTCGNAVVAHWLKGGQEAARYGAPVSTGFGRQVPADFRVVWESGEESGTISGALDRLATDRAERAERTFKELAVWLPRLVYFAVMIFLAYQIFKLYRQVYGPAFDMLDGMGL